MQSFHGLAIPETLAEAAARETTALVVYDMQIGILHQLAHGPAVLGVLALARSAAIRVFFMRHMSLPERLAGVFQLGR